MENEKRLIDSKPLMENGWHLVQTGESNSFLRSMSLADVPTVDAVEVVHGQWVKDEKASENHIEAIYVCSACQNWEAWGVAEKTNYCPNCGAKMDGGNKDG